MRLKDKVAIVTGSGRGIGEATAIRFSEEGAKVVLNDVAKDNAERVVNSIKTRGGEAIAIIADISKAEEAKRLIDETVKFFGKIDILVNNAGINRDMLIKNMGEKDWDDVIDIDLKGTFLCCKFASKYMVEKNYGKIINSSSRSYLGNPGQANYAAAKAGVIGLTKALAKELGRYNINVNAVAPGMINTDLVKNHPKADMIIEMAIKRTPLKRIGEPIDVANVILFLASDESSFVTGDVIHITGGRFG